MNLEQEKEGRQSICVKIDELGNACLTIFEPQSSSTEMRASNASSFSPPATPPAHAPEKKITLFALRLAVLEKAATGLGTLSFIWATVVLLGGFAITLDKTDFWFITTILVVEGTRIFSRSYELEWQHQATWSVADTGRISTFQPIKEAIFKTIGAIFHPIDAVIRQQQKNRECTNGPVQQQVLASRTWETSDVPLLPYAQWVFLSRHVSRLLHWLQLVSALACAVLSLIKLIKQNYGDVEKGDTDKRNRHSSLTIFYSLALAEALLFLLEKAYWEWKVGFCQLLDEVNKECELGPSGPLSIRRFFYDAYSRCVNGSIFDGLKMDMVSFAMELLASTSPDEQLIGVRILRKFATSERFSDDTLQKIGITLSVMERLVEMLNWEDRQEEIRQSAAEILSKLAGKKQNSLRVAGIPGAMESISSLLQNHRTFHGAANEIAEKKTDQDHPGNNCFWTFNHLGLVILKKLARDHDNCGKIGNTRGLLPKIIDFTHAGEGLLEDESFLTPSQILTVKRSLQLLKMLASTTGHTGRKLRKEISEVVFTISNMRDILRYGQKHSVLQRLSIEILTSLALEVDATERIGSTGGVLKELFNIFFKEGIPGKQNNNVRVAAGEALAMLTLESRSNCHQVLKLKVVEKLVEAILEVRFLQINAARILTNLCTYSGPHCYMQLREISAAAPTVLRAIKSKENKLQEVMVGLAAQIFKFMTSQESSNAFNEAGIQEAELAGALIEILKKYQYPPIKTPRIRRFVIELAIRMMSDKEENIQVLKDLGLDRELDNVIETTSEVESFSVFSGTVGLSRHRTTIHSLVETARQLLEGQVIHGELMMQKSI